MRNGFDGLAALVQTQLCEDPLLGQLFVFRGKAGDPVKILWWSGDGLCLFAKRLERGRFVWPQATHGTVSLRAAQLSMLDRAPRTNECLLRFLTISSSAPERKVGGAWRATSSRSRPPFDVYLPIRNLEGA